MLLYFPKNEGGNMQGSILILCQHIQFQPELLVLRMWSHIVSPIIRLFLNEYKAICLTREQRSTPCVLVGKTRYDNRDDGRQQEDNTMQGLPTRRTVKTKQESTRVVAIKILGFFMDNRSNMFISFQVNH